MYRPITVCRLCKHDVLHPLMELGTQHLTGIFPSLPDIDVPAGPMTLGICQNCSLVQLLESYDPDTLYGEHYGYRSNLNRSMVAHLRSKANALRKQVSPGPNDLVVDIGSNDGTTLMSYPRGSARLVGFDPSAGKFRHFYRDDITLIVDFFSANRLREAFGDGAKAKIVSSIAMFYDLEDPTGFMAQIEGILAKDGIWHFEQSYLPAMLSQNAYDTVCHEHLEYYSLAQIKRMTDQVGLKILAVEQNMINGGSFAVTVAKRSSAYPEAVETVARLLEAEKAAGIDDPATYAAFKTRVEGLRRELVETLEDIRRKGQLVLGYGASTKGNVILQYCGVTPELLPAIAEVNEGKFGCYTPGTNIPIVSEAEAKARRPDYFLVLPWHFRENLLAREKDFLAAGGKMLFPLPHLEIVGK